MPNKIRLLRYISQETRKRTRLINLVQDILIEYVHKGTLISFQRNDSRLDTKILDSVVFEISYKKDKSINLVLRYSEGFSPLQGAELSHSGFDEIISLDKKCIPSLERLKELIMETIEIRVKGETTEELCRRDILYLIKYDKEVSKHIKDVEYSTKNQDRAERTDLILVGRREKKNVPLQIKSGILEQEEHRSVSHVPSIFYKTYLLRAGWLKNYVVSIFKSYPEASRHF